MFRAQKCNLSWFIQQLTSLTDFPWITKPKYRLINWFCQYYGAKLP